MKLFQQIYSIFVGHTTTGYYKRSGYTWCVPGFFNYKHTTMKEDWKQIPGYEGYYEINRIGQIKSLSRKRWVKINNSFGITKERILKANSKPYRMVYLSKDGIKEHLSVHYLMAITFLGFSKNNKNIIVDHIDGDHRNNELSNLQVISQRDNVLKGNGFKGGVTFEKGNSSWRVRYNGKHIGNYKTKEVALEVWTSLHSLK